MAQTHLQKTPLGNAIKTCHISVLSISLSIDLSLFLRNSSQFTLQGLEQPSAGAFNHSALETQWAAAGQGLTFIGYQVDRWLSQRQFSILPQLRYVFYSIDTFTLHSQVGFFRRTQQTVEMFIQVQQWMNVEKTCGRKKEKFNV